MYNYNHLYYFYVTAKLSGVSNAAKFLRISQPSLSSQLKVLEASMNKKLFEKRGRRLALTVEGEKTYAYCSKIFSLAEEMNEAFKNKSDQTFHKVRIGISDQLEQPFIADILSPLLKERKTSYKNTFVITSARDADLLQALRTQEIDLVLTNRPSYANDLSELSAVSMPVALMVSTENMQKLRFKISRNTPIRDFIEMVPWSMVMASDKVKLRQETDIFFQELKMQKAIVLESDILSVVGRAILDGAGFGFMPVPYMHEEIKHQLISTFGPKQGFWKHRVHLLARKQDSYEPAIEDVKKCMREIEKLN